MDLIVSVLSFIASVVGEVGLWRCFLAIVGLFVVGLIWKNLLRLDRVLDRLERRWRKTPNWAKPSICLLVLLVCSGALWAAVPKTPMFLAVALGAGTVWWLGGVRHIQRYELTGVGPTAGWRHHYNVTRGRHKLTQAMETASVKSGGRARKPTPTPDGVEFVAEPHDGQSAAEYAEEVNAGRHNAATARKLGWDAVKTMTAIEQVDGTVLVKVSREQTAQEADPLVDANWWDGKP